MTYSPAIPQANQLISQSQADLLANFSVADAVMGVNHVNFDNSLPLIAMLGYLTAPADEGKHTIVHLKRVDAVLPSIGTDPTTVANEGAIYAKIPPVGIGATTELYYRHPSNGIISQLTGLYVQTAANGGTAGGNNNWINTPWGIRIIWGQSAVAFTHTGKTIVAPAGTISVLTYQLTATDASNPINGAQLAGITVTGYAKAGLPVGAVWFILGTY